MIELTTEPGPPFQTAITLDPPSLIRWAALAEHYKMRKATVLTHLIMVTVSDASLTAALRGYSASHEYKCSGPLRVNRINITLTVRQALYEIGQGISEGSNLSQVIRALFAFWAQYTGETITC